MSGVEKRLELITGGMARAKVDFDGVMEDGRVDDCEIPVLFKVQAQNNQNLAQMEAYLLGFTEALQMLTHGQLSIRMLERLDSRARDVAATYGTRGTKRGHLRLVASIEPEPPDEAA